MKKTTTAEAALLITETCDGVRDLLLSKNAAYGNSALDPVRIFSKASPVEQLLVRLDDKLSRLARGSSAGEDVELDLLGYLVLLRVARELEKERCRDNVRPLSSCEGPARRGTRTAASSRASAVRDRRRAARSGAGNTGTRSKSVSRRSRSS